MRVNVIGTVIEISQKYFIVEIYFLGVKQSLWYINPLLTICTLKIDVNLCIEV